MGLTRGKQSILGESEADEIHRCPKCGRVFDTSNGMKTHHVIVHGESIAGVEVDCAFCGETLRRRRWKIENFEKQFCDNECRGKWKTHQHSEERNCEWCGSVFRKTKSAIERRPKHDLCSRECWREWCSAEWVNENHPNWRGGKEGYKGPSWEPQRERAIQRDGEKCVMCGRSEESHYRMYDIGLHVHHIIPFRVYGLKNHQEANRLDNLITVCQSCHRSIEPISQRRADEILG